MHVKNLAKRTGLCPAFQEKRTRPFDKQQAAFIVPLRDKGSGQGVEHTTTVHALWGTCPLVSRRVRVYHVAHTRYTRSNTQGPAARKGERSMKVTHVKTRIVRTPADNPLVIGIPVGNATREFVTLELGTDAGVEGIGLTFFGGPLTVALRDAVEALGALVMGENPMQVEAVAAKLRQAASGAGPGKLFTLALSAIDIAL